MIIGGKAREDTPNPLAPGGQVAAAAALAHGFSRGATRVPRCRSNHKSPARENTQMVKIPEIPGLIRPCHRKSSSGSRSFSPRLQPWETRHERPCATGIPGARYQARGYPIEMPVEKATPRKKGNIVQPTDRRIPPLPRPPNSGSRSFSRRLQSWGNAPRAAGHPGRPDARYHARGDTIEMPGKTRAERPCTTGMPDARNQARVHH